MRLDPRLMPGDSLEGLCHPMTDVVLDHEPAEQHRQQHADTREDKIVESPNEIKVFSNTAASPTTIPTTRLSTRSWFLSDKRDMGLNFGIFVQI